MGNSKGGKRLVIHIHKARVRGLHSQRKPMCPALMPVGPELGVSGLQRLLQLGFQAKAPESAPSSRVKGILNSGGDRHPSGSYGKLEISISIIIFLTLVLFLTPYYT